MILIKRNNTPVNWCPPCEKVEGNEKFVDEAIREVFEETAIIPDNPISVEIWHNNLETVFPTFVSKTTTSKVVLSNEHSNYKW